MTGAISLETISKAKNGDAQVLTELYEKHRLSVFRYFYYQVGDKQAAEDLTSEVFVRMLGSIEKYHPRAVPFEAWLFKIARNLVADYYRSKKHVIQLPLDEETPDANDAVTTSVEDQLTSERLVDALQSLNQSQREVIILRFVNRQPINQVAKMMNKSENSIKGLQRRALLSLRETLTDGEVQDD
jgi:RNA polymerase sigma-70 factor (ECF subfamily)